MTFLCGLAVVLSWLVPLAMAQQEGDFLRQLQFQAVEAKQADWAYWGDRPNVFSSWTNHSNRLIPVYTFGMKLDAFKGVNSVYRNQADLEKLYGQLPLETLNPTAEYFDQTDIYSLQLQAYLRHKKKNIILIVFDGMDWQTTQAASVYKNRKVLYTEGRGSGLAFLDCRPEVSDFGYFVTSPHDGDTETDVDSQQVTLSGGENHIGGYNVSLGGATPWSRPADPAYLLGRRRSLPHWYTDSAASATSMTSGKKTYNSSINVGVDGAQFVPLARQLQEKGKSIGVVTSVPISHATPASCYANNVSRNDYQDLTRDLLGLKSISHPRQALPGVDVLIGCGWGQERDDERGKQGRNYVPGNKYLTAKDLGRIRIEQGGPYVVAQRTAGKSGREVLCAAAVQAKQNQNRLLGFFGVEGGHLPFQTADGGYNPTRGVTQAERYSAADIFENPTLADMTSAALQVLQTNEDGFWLMIEPGDVDWANHNNNLDNSIGAVFSGEAAFEVVVDWVQRYSSWDETVVIVTADHGHMLVMKDLQALTGSSAKVETKKR